MVTKDTRGEGLSFIDWAIERARKVTVTDGIEYEGRTYKEVIRMFEGHLNPGRVRGLRNEIGSFPVNEGFRQVSCVFGGTYKSEAGFVRVIETIYEEV
ncbi:hypothetical protein DSCO28_73040 (plasmid) [Desulfosarcina ovata subsp. sediminis]|uniref:Uncharacterized protein n=1 Tax=Desulfosarcina ovata subsp. sediminis TaxID=885957 RepID=A0A5K8A2U9_9BACT|nr:hypothetical protein [Desulfosarcina ovata]BBO86738.1 hypothetical protein DSCO28_73040 [Desulfosarcina ovata subsp. sediminis]